MGTVIPPRVFSAKHLNPLAYVTPTTSPHRRLQERKHSLPVAVDILSLQESLQQSNKAVWPRCKKRGPHCTSDEVMSHKSQYLLEQMHRLSFQGPCRKIPVIRVIALRKAQSMATSSAILLIYSSSK